MNERTRPVWNDDDPRNGLGGSKQESNIEPPWWMILILVVVFIAVFGPVLVYMWRWALS